MKDLAKKAANYFRENNHTDVKTVLLGTREELEIDGIVVTRFDILAEASRVTSEQKAWEILRLASDLFQSTDDPTFNELYGAVARRIVSRFTKNELYYQELFKSLYSKIRDGQIVTHKNNGKDIPDAWVNKHGDLIPVEIKLGKFDSKALKQLLRYMKAYKCKNGIAVGMDITVKIPEEIEFISLEELEKVR